MPTLELTAGGVLEGRVVDGAGRPVAGVAVAALAGDGREVSVGADDERLRRFSGRAMRPPAAGAGLVGGPAAASADATFLPRGELGVMLGPIPYPPAAGAGVLRTAAIVDDVRAAGRGGGRRGQPGRRAARGVEPTAVTPIAPDPAYLPTWTTGANSTSGSPASPPGPRWRSGSPGPSAGAQQAAHRPARPDRGRGRPLRRLVDGVFVAGRVTDQRGAAVAGALLGFEPASAGGRDDDALAGAPGALQAVTDADGRYRAGPLAGPTALRVSAFGHADLVTRLDLASSADNRANVLPNVVLVVADAELTGLVEDPTGLPVVGAHVEVAGGPADGRAATVGAGGRWTIARCCRRRR